MGSNTPAGRGPDSACTSLRLLARPLFAGLAAVAAGAGECMSSTACGRAWGAVGNGGHGAAAPTGDSGCAEAQLAAAPGWAAVAQTRRHGTQ